MHIRCQIIIFLNAIVFTIQERSIILDNDPKINDLQAGTAKDVLRELLGTVIPDAVGAALLKAFEDPSNSDQIEMQDFTEFSSNMRSKKTGKTVGSVQITVERKNRNEENSMEMDKNWFEINEECPAD